MRYVCSNTKISFNLQVPTSLNVKNLIITKKARFTSRFLFFSLLTLPLSTGYQNLTPNKSHLLKKS